MPRNAIRDDRRVKQLGQALKALREAKGLSQADFARLAGIPRGSLVNYEQGRREPSGLLLIDLLRALGGGLGPWAEMISDAHAPEEEPPPPAKRGRPRKSP